MESLIYAGIGLLVLLVVIGGVFLLAPSRRRRRDQSAPVTTPGAPGTGVGTGPGETAPGEGEEEPAGASAPVLETPTEPTSRLARLRDRLAKSNTTLGRGLLTLLSRETLDEQTWEEVEDLLIMADIGVDPTTEIVDSLRERVRVLGTRDPQALTELLREELVRAVDPTMERALAVEPIDGSPRVVLVVGVNGAGKTTTVGKIARVLVAQDRSVLLGAADTFRAAAAEQLSTWGSRVGVETVRKEEGADPASVAYTAVERGIDEGVDVVMIDTAGRLQNKKGLMDELGKVKRVAARPLGDEREIDEVLLVLDATTGQNGLQQAKVFSEAVNITGIVLTKLDGTAKGGIVVAVQRTLGVPVKLIGLGEGADDLAPFDAHEFVDAIVDG
ncbi:MAG: signal recognition particle-docking protein FtsY [Brevibacterium yomogidense]|uniref:Signal recognition particle receptor FtsY n=1 Tax=Brevibacterium yomogidense TaxID=946573 RepID=A0A1X6XJM2_9MICO|nr:MULTISPECIES: signal recognition particle-docking protein FtsY [Brevibacterium]SLM99525.1 Signal recognition particle receptor protein FtsY (=alpha subunit) (TC 3.A.5.1.1) [Brevibacterium yomogidense]SMX70430.1 signal recognition particle-docking protein FtsY [Brevibacterium sp. Mu109]